MLCCMAVLLPFIGTPALKRRINFPCNNNYSCQSTNQMCVSLRPELFSISTALFLLSISTEWTERWTIERHLECAISEKCQTRTGVRSAGSSSSPSSWLSSISSITSALASATSSLSGRLVFTELTKGCWNTEHTLKDYSEFFITVQTPKLFNCA